MCTCSTFLRFLLHGSAILAEAMDVLDKADAWMDAGAASTESAALLSVEGRGILSEFEGRRVSVTGVFDHSKEVLVGERYSPPPK